MKQQKADGIVYLVGAGPGDYKLISLRGLELIKEAGVIVYDRLLDKRLLSFAGKDAECLYVGKIPGKHTLTQDGINQLLVDKAREGKRVVRLKGGDPFVFGRGGEEALFLVKHNIDFEIIPGISSAIAVPAYAGIPVTQRGVAASFGVVTGHEDPDKPNSAIHWDKLATGVDTLVFLMGMENLAHIAAQLMQYGKRADTPAAVICCGTKPEQTVLITTLQCAAGDAANAGIKPPAVFIVGEVVKLREELAWFDRRPLFGKTVLVTRAREQARQLTDKLEGLGASCLEAPAIEILPPDDFAELDEAIQNLPAYQWLIFTSVNGVDYFFRRLEAAGLDTRSLSLKVAAIGTATAERLKTHGINADIVPADFRAEGILAALDGSIKPGMRVLIPRTPAARDILPARLRDKGAEVTVVTAYKTGRGHIDRQLLSAKFSAGEIDIVTFTSSSTVVHLLSSLGDEAVSLITRAKVACIGPVTAATCLKHGIKPDIIAEKYTMQGLTEAIVSLVEEEVT